MTTSETNPPAAAWQPLDARQRRVLGVLLEKAATTPAAYPMTVNAIVTGCNQKNNRDPLTSYDDFDVAQALRELQELKVVSEIDWMGRATKYKHHAFEWFGVNRVEMAVMTELLLRGAQALGELRARAARMTPIEDLAALKPVVQGLLERRLMIELTPPGRGQVVSHGVYTQAELADLLTRHAGQELRSAVPARESSPRGRVAEESPGPAAAPVARDSLRGDTVATAAELADLRAEVARLRERIDALEARIREPGI